MAENSVWGLIFIITLSDVVSKTQLFIHGNSHGYIPANNEVRYLVDELPLHKDFSSGGAVRISSYDEDLYVSSPHLRLNPRILDFKDRPLGVPHHEKVIVFNTNGNKTLQLTSISGNTVHFHSSFFEDKVIPPLGNTSFSVVFLGREEGTIESTLFIHTSEGSIKYPVKGNSVSSPYRLRPLVGVHMPINASFAPLIHMHNPHANPIQIVEIYSSGGELSLELPTGELEAAKNLWEILPFETKPVIRARLLAQAHRNHTCYVRIRVNGSSEHLVIPLEVEVGAAPGLYPPEPSLDLGVLGSEFPPVRLSLRLHNSGRKSTLIQNVFTVPATKAVNIDFHSIKVPPDSKEATEVAVITFDPRAAYEEKHFSGKIVVKGKNRLVIPYNARVLHGGLKFNASVASFCTDQVLSEGQTDTGGGREAAEELVPRNFTVTNTFLTPLVIGNVSLAPEAEKYFIIRHFTPQVIAPGEEIVLFELAPNITSITQNFHLESYIQIVTNVSVVSAPLLCYDGHVIKVIPPSELGEDDSLELGLVGVESRRVVEFALLNPNPVEVEMEEWGLDSCGGEEVAEMEVELLGVGSGSRDDVLALWAQPPTNLSQTMSLQPHQYAVFRVSITAGLAEGYSSIDVFIDTPFERIIVPLHIHVAKGSLLMDPEVVVFDDSFPGKVSSQPIQVHSTFQEPMKVTSLSSIRQPDKRLSFVKLADVSVRPFATTVLGELLFDPRLACTDHCYLGVDFNTAAGAQWLQGFSLTTGTGVWEQDATLLSTMYMWFLSSIAAPRSWHNSTLRLDTSEVRAHQLEVATRLVWPSLANSVPQRHLNFPLTQVGNVTRIPVPIHNPADTPLLLQIALGEVYSPMHTMLSALPVKLHPPIREAREANPGEFSISAVVPDGRQPWVSDFATLRSVVGVVPHEETLTLLLPPGATFILHVEFTPASSVPATTLLYIRNNLTVVEVVRVSGQGAVSQFKFGNRKPGSPTPLQFDLSEKHLKDCTKSKNRKFQPPMLTVKRSFTARNNGELPVYVASFLINDLPCEGFGFKVLNCKPFLLTANSSRKVEIAFSPDFTLARVQRVLKILTTIGPGELGSVNYSLVATLPVSLLAPCGQAIPRPSWEALFYYSLLVFMIFLLLCTVAAALIESDRIHKTSLGVAVAAANSTYIRLNPRPTSMIVAAYLQHQQEQQQLQQQQGKGDAAERKRELNISTSNRTQPDSGKDSHKKHHTPDDHDDSLEAHNKHDNKGGGASTSPPNQRGSKRKLSKKHSSGQSDGGEASQQQGEWGASPSPSPPQCKSQLETGSRKTAWSDMFSRSSKGKDQEDSGKRGGAPQTKGGRKNRQQQRQQQSQQQGGEAVANSEEDTSSTTTESSNNDDVDKDHSSSGSGGGKTGREAHTRDSYEGDGEEDEDEPRTRRGGNKTSKQTKASLEQPADSSSSSGSRQGSQSSTSSRSSASEPKTKAGKQAQKDKNSQRQQPSSKRRAQQERAGGRAEGDSGKNSGSLSVTWEAPSGSTPAAPESPDPAGSSSSSSSSALLYSKILAPLPENPSPVHAGLAPALRTAASDSAAAKKKPNAPGPIGPMALPKRSVPPMPARSKWDYNADNRLGFTNGVAPAMLTSPMESPQGLLDFEPTGLLSEPGSWEPTLSSNSVMKVLQEERRRRVEQHQQRLYHGYVEPWSPRFEPAWEATPPPLYCPPGQTTATFGASEPTAETLWDVGSGGPVPMWTGTPSPWLPTAAATQEDSSPPPPAQTPPGQAQQPPQSTTPDIALEGTPQFDLFGSSPVTNLWELPHASWVHGGGGNNGESPARPQT